MVESSKIFFSSWYFSESNQIREGRPNEYLEFPLQSAKAPLILPVAMAINF